MYCLSNVCYSDSTARARGGRGGMVVCLCLVTIAFVKTQQMSFHCHSYNICILVIYCTHLAPSKENMDFCFWNLLITHNTPSCVKMFTTTNAKNNRLAMFMENNKPPRPHLIQNLHMWSKSKYGITNQNMIMCLKIINKQGRTTYLYLLK